MSQPRSCVSVAVVDGNLYTIGGESKPKWLGDWLTNENLMYTTIGYAAATLSPLILCLSKESQTKVDHRKSWLRLWFSNSCSGCYFAVLPHET